MSKVISFRLNRDNPRERQALEIIKILRSEGHSIRSIVVEALLCFSASKNDSDQLKIEVLNDTLNQIIHFLHQVVAAR